MSRCSSSDDDGRGLPRDTISHSATRCNGRATNTTEADTDNFGVAVGCESAMGGDPHPLAVRTQRVRRQGVGGENLLDCPRGGLGCGVDVEDAANIGTRGPCADIFQGHICSGYIEFGCS